MSPDGSYAPSDPVEIPTGAQSEDPEFLGTHQRLMRLTHEHQARARAARLQGG